MSRHKLRVHNTPLDNLIANLRGEIGEIIATWTMMRHLMSQERRLSSGDVATDMRNQELVFLSILVQKLGDELVARLSELAEITIGRLTFHFASLKLNALQGETQAFRSFIQRYGFDEKRNYDISHKELPEQWFDHKMLHIPYRRVRRAIAHASSIMKKIDRIVLGPSAKYLWHEMRARRYSAMDPPKAAYMLIPYLNLSKRIRTKIILEEMEEGRAVWSEMVTKINGIETTIQVCKTWAAIALGGEIIVLDAYPLQGLTEIKLMPTSGTPEDLFGKPIYEQKKICAKFRVEELSESKILLVPVQNIYQLDETTFTELQDITINLDDKIKSDIGMAKVGDVKELSLTVTVLSSYEVRTEGSSASPP